MPVFLVRVVLADRPGALGAVASRIGAVRGDVVGFEIVERAAGRAVDEFVVELAEESHVELLVMEIEQVDGCGVELVRRLPGRRWAGRLDAYDAAVTLVTERTTDGLLQQLAALVARELDAEWVAVAETESAGTGVLACHGRTPAHRWVAAYAAEVHASGARDLAADMAAARLPNWDVVVIACRPGWPFGEAQRRRLDALAGLADARWTDLGHPARSTCSA